MRLLSITLALILLSASCEDSKTDQESTEVLQPAPPEPPRIDDFNICDAPPPPPLPPGTGLKEYPTIPTTDSQIQVEDVGNVVLRLLAESNWEGLMDLTHEAHKVVLANSVYIGDNKRSFYGNELSFHAECNKKFDWYINAPSGESPKLTITEFYDNYFKRTLTSGYDLYINEWLSWSTTINNMKEAFPDCQIVQALNEGEEEMDWSALNMIFKKIEGKFFLVGLVSDSWTP